MYEFYYDYVKAKYGENAKLCHMNTDSLIVHVKTDDTYKDISEDVERRFDTSNIELEKVLPKEKSKKVIGVMNDELRGKVMKEFVGLRAKPCSYLIDDGSEDKKAKGTIKCLIKRKLKFEDYKSSLEATQLETKINHLGKNKTDVFKFEKIIKKS